jgi:glycosyltransferase involved in cell wall biosynthesis
MSDDVMQLLNNEDRRLEFGRKAREAAVSRYGSELIIPQYIAFYEKVLNLKAETRPV